MKKYKLINTKTKEETICSKVTIDGFDYYLGDKVDLYMKNIEINEYYIEHTQVNPDRYSLFKRDIDQYTIEGSWKIICTNNTNIDIPKIVDEVEKLASEFAFCYPGSQTEEEYDSKLMGWYYGYNRSQETHPNSDEDMIDFSIWRTTTNTKEFNDCRNVKEQLQLWKEQQPNKLFYR